MASMTRKLVLCASMLSLFVILTSSTQVYAIDETAIKATDQIKNNPALMHMLKKIELSKKNPSRDAGTKESSRQKCAENAGD